MAIDRTAYNALVDDDGSNTVGTPWTKDKVKTVVLDPVDAAIAADVGTETAARIAVDAAIAADVGTETAARIAADALKLGRAPLVVAIASSATPTPNVDVTDLYDITAQAAAAAFGNPTGTPSNGQRLRIRIKDDGTARALTYGSAYAAGGVALPATTVLSKILTLDFVYDTANALNKWLLTAVAQEGATASGGSDTIVASTVTGAQNNWAPAIVGHSLIEWAGAADAAFTGLAGGVAGQRVTVKNTGTKIATFAHSSGSSTAGNKFLNLATSAPTPIAPGGYIIYEHNGTNWQLVGHEQGDLITPVFSAGAFTSDSGTFVMDAGDVQVYASKLVGRLLTLFLNLSSFTVTGTPGELRVAIPGGFAPSLTAAGMVQAGNNGVYAVALCSVPGSLAAYLRVYSTIGAGTWGASANNSAITGSIAIPVL